jgi:outer membrane biosynthesis protein TonB
MKNPLSFNIVPCFRESIALRNSLLILFIAIGTAVCGNCFAESAQSAIPSTPQNLREAKDKLRLEESRLEKLLSEEAELIRKQAQLDEVSGRIEKELGAPAPEEEREKKKCRLVELKKERETRRDQINRVKEQIASSRQAVQSAQVSVGSFTGSSSRTRSQSTGPQSGARSARRDSNAVGSTNQGQGSTVGPWDYSRPDNASNLSRNQSEYPDQNRDRARSRASSVMNALMTRPANPMQGFPTQLFAPDFR